MKKIKVEVEITVASSQECCEVFGLEPRHFQQLVKSGRVEGKIAHNEYDLARVGQTYFAYLRGEG